MTGIQAFVELLYGAGVRHVFGNPGTTELPLNDLLVDDRRIGYILGLQEVPVMSMADGYAMASGSLGVVNLHACCGLGNAMGMLYNAHREGTPLLVTAGQQDRRLKFEEPILGGDMVAVARPWTKWAAEVERVEDLASAVRRAVTMALTPPTGPVFLSLPLDVQTAAGQFDLTPIPRLDTRVRPPLAALEQAANVLLSATNPAILVGSRVVERDAVAELVAVAERLGATVMSEPGHTNGRLQFSRRPSALRPDAAPLVARNSRAAGPLRRAAGGRHGFAAAVHLSRTRAGRSRNRLGSFTSMKTPTRSARTIRSRSACWETPSSARRARAVARCPHHAGRCRTSPPPRGARAERHRQERLALEAKIASDRRRGR